MKLSGWNPSTARHHGVASMWHTIHMGAWGSRTSQQPQYPHLVEGWKKSPIITLWDAVLRGQ
eukprot:2680033-Pyramimonas_sp.AAC.1